jgi:hypothetical protein
VTCRLSVRIRVLDRVCLRLNSAADQGRLLSQVPVELDPAESARRSPARLLSPLPLAVVEPVAARLVEAALAAESASQSWESQADTAEASCQVEQDAASADKVEAAASPAAEPASDTEPVAEQALPGQARPEAASPSAET